MLTIFLLTFLAQQDAGAAAPTVDVSRRYRLEDEVTYQDTQATFVWAMRLVQNPTRGDVVYEIDSPGGSLDAALKIATVLRVLGRAGFRVICVIDGRGISAAYLILQSPGCQVRVMTTSSYLMAHEPRAVMPEGTKLTPEQEEGLRQHIRVIRNGMAAFGSNRLKISRKDYERRTSGREWWLTPEEALRYGAVDRLVAAPDSV